MKKILPLIIAITVFASCSKEASVIEPTDSTSINQLFFKDNNLAVYSISAGIGTTTSNKIDFSTLYEKNITKL
jgi:hypothetical protein